MPLACDDTTVIALVEQVQDGILVEPQVLFAGSHGEPVLQPLGERLQSLDNAPHVGARALGLIDGETPDGFSFHKVRTQRGALALHALGKERITVC